jgi:hypothetical protein
MGLLGMKTLRRVEAGREIGLRPAEGVAEARRADFERRHPRPAGSWGLAWLVLDRSPNRDPRAPAVDRQGGGVRAHPAGPAAPLANRALGVLALAAALDRALRFKSSRWLG